MATRSSAFSAGMEPQQIAWWQMKQVRESLDCMKLPLDQFSLLGDSLALFSHP